MLRTERMVLRMWKYIGRKVTQSGIVLFVGSIICFIAMHFLPGSIAYGVYGANAQRLTEHEIERLEATLIGDESILVQYLTWVRHIWQGEFGFSYSQQQPVSQIIMELAIPTIVIVLLAIILTNIFVTLFVNILQMKRGRLLQWLSEAFLFCTTIMPSFWLCFLLLWVFAVALNWFPLNGIGDGSFISLLYHMFLPSLALSLSAVFYGVKLIQDQLITVQKFPFIIQLRKRRISGFRYFQHTFPHIALVYLQLNGYLITAFIGGTIAIETVFSLPGLGRLTVEATKNHDYPLLMMILLLGLAVILASQLVIDILSSLIDPRVYKSLKE